MNTIRVPEPAAEIPTMVKIGVVAKHLGISIRTIHMYERERLFISYKNRAGTRLFNEEDIAWLIEIRRLIKASISIAGIRSLLALIPCWDVTKCQYDSRQTCPSLKDNQFPCWSNKESHCYQSVEICRACKVYSMRFRISDLKGFTDIRMKPELVPQT
ncbi:MAG: MerR family transcriptional regulator [Magnetococcales bacterium]|nr:MerR family transcriptional regulator [Magnetococcales bacterium]NGZ06064.1 MerR family transcriptional regulator [Magnetococcales bacterium]